MGRILSRLVKLQRQLFVLWRAFWHRATPLYIKAIMIAITAYIISPIDLLPDFLVGLGVVDDILLLVIATNWLVSKLPQEVFYNGNDASSQKPSNEDDESVTIDGTSRKI